MTPVNKRCATGCPPAKRLPPPPKFVEVKIEGDLRATCTGRNGVFDIEAVCLDDAGNGSAQIGFVSRSLHRRVNAGAVIPAGLMDKLAKRWLRMRGLDTADLPEKGEIRDYAEKLESMSKSMLEMLEGM